MNFFEHQDDARRKTGRLVYLFVLAVITIVLSIYLLFATLIVFGKEKENQPIDYRGLWNPKLFVATLIGVGGVIGAGSLYRSASLRAGGKSVAELLGGRLLDASTRDLQERRLLNIVEEMALASGMPVPPVYLMDQESGVNAFAAGFSPADAVIGVTRGTVSALTRDELQGVIAHEYSHILNGDMRLNLRLIGVLYGILLLSMIGYIVMRMMMSTRTSSSSSSSSSSSDKKSDSGGVMLAFFVVGLGLYVIGYIGVFFGHLIKSAVSRQREYLADASAVQFTRNPEGIAGALKKIGALGSRIQSEQAEQASHMFFGNGMKASFLSMLSTHPPLLERIQRIEPTFNGDFAKDKLQWPEETQPAAVPEKKKKSGAGKRSPFPAVFGGVLAGEAAMANLAGAAAPSMPRSLSAAGAVANVGEPSTKHFEFAAALLDRIPEKLGEALHDPLGATQVLYALLLQADPADDEPGLRLIADAFDEATAGDVSEYVEFVAPMGAAARLPMAQIAMSALRRLTPPQFDLFRKTVVGLIRADRRVSMFEYCLQRMIIKHLVDFFRPKPPKKVVYKRLGDVADQVAVLLSATAYAGSDDTQNEIDAFYEAGQAKLGEEFRQPIASRSECGFAAVDTALDALSRSSGAVKQPVLEACAAVIGADGRMTIDEGELLRTIADALDCPMPPPAAELMVDEAA
ncbi:MAG: M48 family metalloprotease [Planctomycetia bacterium]|nr:M48 family metalloprotease [Planctomycetia bacterium]